jgi:hypothetical protein
LERVHGLQMAEAVPEAFLMIVLTLKEQLVPLEAEILSARSLAGLNQAAIRHRYSSAAAASRMTSSTWKARRAKERPATSLKSAETRQSEVDQRRYDARADYRPGERWYAPGRT